MPASSGPPEIQAWFRLIRVSQKKKVVDHAPLLLCCSSFWGIASTDLYVASSQSGSLGVLSLLKFRTNGLIDGNCSGPILGRRAWSSCCSVSLSLNGLARFLSQEIVRLRPGVLENLLIHMYQVLESSTCATTSFRLQSRRLFTNC